MADLSVPKRGAEWVKVCEKIKSALEDEPDEDEAAQTQDAPRGEPRAGAWAAPRGSETPPSQLPPDIADFTGRRALVGALLRLFRSRPEAEGTSPTVADIAGMAGVGKSTLAVHVAHLLKKEFPDGQLYINLRGAGKRRRKRYGAYDSHGRLAGKRLISERPAEVEARGRVGHLEADTVMGAVSEDCVVTPVERKTGLVVIGKLADRTAESLSRRALSLMRRRSTRFETVTGDNSTEFHGYERIERRAGVTFYFARPYHSWERGSNENANGLIRQYLPKGVSMAGLSQHLCNAIARKLNTRPRKRLGFRTPLECFNEP